jgi:hypothetical protein
MRAEKIAACVSVKLYAARMPICINAVRSRIL